MLRHLRVIDDVPEPVAEAEAHVRPLGAVMVHVVAPDVLEVASPERAEVHAVMHPLLHDVGEEESCHHHRRRVQRRERRGGDEDDGPPHGILERAVHVVAVPRTRVMLDVEVVEPAVQIALHARPVGKAAVQHVAVNQVLGQRPDHDPAAEIHERGSGVTSRERDREQHRGIRGVQHRGRIQPVSRLPSLDLPPDLARVVRRGRDSGALHADPRHHRWGGRLLAS